MSKRKWTWWIVAPVATLVLLLIIAQPLLGKYVGHKLVTTVEERTNATLTVGSVTYLPPYGVRVQNATFTVPDDQTGSFDMVKVATLELRLAKLPLGPGPLVIKRVLIDRPEVRLIKTDQGLLGINGLVKPGHKKNQSKKKLSDIFELRHLAIKDGQITYEDRTQPNTVPLVWRDLNVNTETRPTSAAVYTYDFAANHASVAQIKSQGTFDIDNLILAAKSLNLRVSVAQGAKESAVPAQIQRLLSKYALRGDLAITGGGTVPLKDLGHADYRLDLTLDHASGRVPKVNQPIDQLAARVRVVAAPDKPIATQLAMEVTSGPNVLHVDQGLLDIDRAADEWNLARLDLRVDATAVGIRPFDIPASAPAAQRKLKAGGMLELTAAGHGLLSAKTLDQWRDRTRFEIVATADDFHTQPPGFEAPLHLVTGAPIVINQDVVRLSNLTGRYGYDQFQITTLRIPLRDLPRLVRVEQLSATATFDRHTPGYPGKVGELAAKFRPEGPFEVGGTLAYDRDAADKLSYHLLVHSDRGAIEYNLGEHRTVPVSRIHADALVEPGNARLDYLEANVFGGVLDATGTAAFGHGKFDWTAKGTCRDFDLRSSVQALTGKKFDTEKLAGQAFVRFDMAGGKTPESVRGEGEARLFNGRLFEVPVLSEVLGKAGLGRGLVGSEAAGTFGMNDGKVLVKHAALGSPAIGVQGSGIVGFDQSLDLDIIVAPLGQWEDRLKQTNIPFVSKALGEVAGAVQSVVNAAASTLLYEFHVGGTGKDPKITPVPAPILSKGAAAVFGKMMGAGKPDTSLGEELKKLDEEEKGTKG